MDRFEYVVREYPAKELARYEMDLQTAGREGWELVGVVPLATNTMLAGATTTVRATFKRRVSAPVPTMAPP